MKTDYILIKDCVLGSKGDRFHFDCETQEYVFVNGRVPALVVKGFSKVAVQLLEQKVFRSGTCEVVVSNGAIVVDGKLLDGKKLQHLLEAVVTMSLSKMVAPVEVSLLGKRVSFDVLKKICEYCLLVSK